MPAAYTQQDVVDWLDRLSDGTLDLQEDNVGLATFALTLLPAQPKPEPVPAGYLSPHFSLAEMTHSDTANEQGLDNTPDAAALQQLTLLCNDTLEDIRTICGDHPVTVSSGYRSPAVNAAVHGADNSAHKYGCAADITIPGYGDPLTVCRTLVPHLAELGLDQVIYETDSEGHIWTHVGRANPGAGPPRGQCFSLINGVQTNSPFPG